MAGILCGFAGWAALVVITMIGSQFSGFDHDPKAASIAVAAFYFGATAAVVFGLVYALRSRTRLPRGFYLGATAAAVVMLGALAICDLFGAYGLANAGH